MVESLEGMMKKRYCWKVGMGGGLIIEGIDGSGFLKMKGKSCKGRVCVFTVRFGGAV